MFAGLGFNLRLRGSVYEYGKVGLGCKLTAMGLDRVRIAKEESFKVNDIAGE